MNSLLLHRRRRSGQRVPKIQKEHVQVRGAWLARRHVPRMANQMGVLHHELHSSIVGITPERVREAEGSLLNRTIVIRWRTVIAKADLLAIRRINGHSLLEVSAAVVRIEHYLWRGLVFTPVNRRGRADQQRTAVASDDQLGALAKDQ